MPDEIVRGARPLNYGTDCPPQEVVNAGLNAGGQVPMNAPPQLGQHPLPRQININPLNHGFHVIVGCQAFAVETVDALLHRLGVYLKDPLETENKWMRGEWKW